METTTTRTTCPYCGVGCGVNAVLENDAVRVSGDETHPSNQGRLCSKGTALADTVGLNDRLLYPMVDGRRASWDEALDEVASRFGEIIAEHGPDAVAFYVSGQLLTEDYYVANKLMKGYIGSANIDTNSRLCMSSAVAGHKRAFGEDVVPGCYEDLELADLVVLVGSNTAWCHPVVYQRIVAAQENDANKKLVVIDPRRTATAEGADLHLPLAPGTDVHLFNGLLAYLAEQGVTSDLPGTQDAVAEARKIGDIDAVAEACGVARDTVAAFFELFANTERTVTVFSQGVNQSSAGTDKVNAILNCHLLTDRIGKPGACPFSITGQPNAMGGREVGGLSSTLAAHMGFDAAERVQRFWNSPAIASEPGLKAVELFANTERTVTVFSQGVNQSSAGTDKVNVILNCHLLTDRIGKPGACPFSITGQPNAMGGREVGGLSSTLAAHMGFDQAERVQRFWNSPAIASEPGLKAVELFEAIERGEIKAVWIMATNPLVSLPHADRAKRALEACEFVAVSDCMRHTDTVDRAHVLLPAAAWAEKSGTVTNSERIISRQRCFLPMPGDTRADWDIICDVARRMGYGDGFGFDSAASIFREHAALTAFENDGERVLNLEGLAELTDQAYDRLEPLRWPVHADKPLRAVGAMPAQQDSRRLFVDGVYPTSDGRAHLVAVTPRGPANAVSDQHPLALNTGRVRDHWHTMTRTAKSARLSGHIPEPFVEVHPRDAERYGVIDGAIATVSTALGEAHVRVIVTDGQREGTLFVPMHWNDQFAARARVGALANPAVCPISGEPEFKHTPSAIAPFDAAWHGFILASRPLRLAGESDIDYWVKIPGERFYRYEIAGLKTPDEWAATARGWIGVGDRTTDWLEAADPAAGRYRAAHMDAGHIEACVFVAPEPAALPERSWLAGLFTGEPVDEAERIGLLAGRPADPGADPGPQVCSCFGVGRNTILRAIDEQGLDSVAAVGKALDAGTNCGSCKPEIASLIAEAQADE